MKAEYAQALEKAALDIFNDKSKQKNLYKLLSYNPHLSFYQCVQVLAVNPNAEVCRTFSEWNEQFDRRIQRGERGIPITEETLPYNKKYVFDIKQTYGKTAYHRAIAVTDEQLLAGVKSQSLWQQAIVGDYKARLYHAIESFCRGGYTGFEDTKNEQQFLSAITTGVFSCVVYKYGKSPTLIEETDYSSLSESEKIRAAVAAAELSKIIYETIETNRRKQNEKQRNTSSNIDKVQKFSADNRGAGSDGRQASLFDFRYEDREVRGTGATISSGGNAGTVSQSDSTGQTYGSNSSSAKGSGGVAGGAFKAVARPEQAVQSDLFTEAPEREHNRAANTRADNGADSLSAALNYRLTSEDFSNVGGAKTKFHNNIAAIKLVHELDAAQRAVTPEEQKILAKYSGWGGIPQAFDSLNQDWQREYQELKNALSLEDYKLAEGSVLNAHYTSKTIIDGIYRALDRLGFKNGTVLEPACGTGNFIGLMPESFTSKVYGVELDSVTGRIAKYLYPQAEIHISGFQDTKFPNNYFDSVITNVPFGAYKVHDSAYNKHNLFIHDYFLVKSIDKLRPGGIMAAITTKGTLDKSNSFARSLLAERAELIGAIRLPNTAFKQSAGTEVTADILFFKKREQAAINVQNEKWLYLSETADGIPVNEYFIDNPNMLLGQMAWDNIGYGNDKNTACLSDNRDLGEALAEAVQYLPTNIYTERKKASEQETTAVNLPADLSVKNFCFSVIDDKIYLRVNEVMVPQIVSLANEARLKAMIDIRSQLRHVLDIQAQNCSDDELTAEQGRLNAAYDHFVRRYGIINSRTNKNLFRDDADYTLLVSLENYNEVTDTVKKSDVFSKRTIRQYTRPTSAESALEALYISKNETGKVDIRIIEKLTGKSYDDIIKELGNAVYRNPIISVPDDKYSGWETATEYLSGNVREKLNVAEAFAKTNPEYTANITALQKAQPEPLTANEISVRPGVTWISANIYKQFLIDKLNIKPQDENSISIHYNHHNGAWSVEAPSWFGSLFEANSLYGTNRMSAYRIYEHALNMQTPSIYDTIYIDGKEVRELNRADTIAAREKLKKINAEFKSWVFDNPVRRNSLVSIYNERFNNSKLASYDGSYLTFPEMNPLVELQPHQKDAVERIITSGNTLLHHVVGAGKTFEIAAAAIKLRQMGLAQKPMMVVPNHLVMQWASEFRTLYPNANILIATKKDMTKENRLRFTSRIAMGDWDAVIMAMTSFERIPLSKERQERKIREEISSIEDALNEARENRREYITIKNLQKTLKDKEASLEKLLDGKKDDLIIFENLGVDYLFVDEAHKYKNKFIFSKMNNVAGISKAASKRASDLDMKIDYINELHRGQKGVVFATGTPISNSMVEMYTLQSYLQRQDLAKAGITYFDCWAANFGETVTALELAPSGQGYRSRTRFAKFTNMPELLTMYRGFADVKTADMLNLPVPKANKHVVMLKPTDEILRLNEIISKRAEEINAGLVTPDIDNMLKITSDGKKLALDPRCFEPAAKDSPEHKVNVCIENAFKIWNDTADKHGTQIIFCDLSVPKKAFADYDPEKDFDVYNHIKFNLVKMGVPENDVAFVHEADTDVRKQTLFENVRSGKVRILLGSTEKCGAGTNVQTRLYALHHLDTPYRPSDLEQREGRIIRQGNTWPEVHIFTYVTERTFDSYSYQILENKQRFISQINRGELTVREVEDIDEATLTYAEIKAITAANPLIKRKHEVSNELGRLQTLEGQYKRNRYIMQDNIEFHLPERIKSTEIRIQQLEMDVARRDKHIGAEFLIEVAGKEFTERKDAGELLQTVIKSRANTGIKVASFNGFDIYAEVSPQTRLDEKEERELLIKGEGSYKITASTSDVGTIARLENFFKNGIEDYLDTHRNNLDTFRRELEAVKLEVDKPYEYEQAIKDLSSELAKIDAELDLDKNEVAPVVDDEKFKTEQAAQDESLDEDDNEDEGERQRPIIKAPAIEKTATPATPASSLKIEKSEFRDVEPLTVYMTTDDKIMVKIPAPGNSAEKTALWLNKNMVQLDKAGKVIKVAEPLVIANNLKAVSVMAPNMAARK